MRIALLAVLSACALAACNPSAPQQNQADAPASNSGGGLFPNLTNASYRSEGNIMRGDQVLPIVMIRDGVRTRMEISVGGGQTVVVSNAETGEAFSLTNIGGRTRAMRMNLNDMGDPAKDWVGDAVSAATRIGPCSGAGQNGEEWSVNRDETVRTACVTSDGIMLKATANGATVWETTSVERGPQDQSLFELPAGVQVMDLNNIPGVAEAMERARAAQGGQ